METGDTCNCEFYRILHRQIVGVDCIRFKRYCNPFGHVSTNHLQTGDSVCMCMCHSLFHSFAYMYVISHHGYWLFSDETWLSEHFAAYILPINPIRRLIKCMQMKWNTFGKSFLHILEYNECKFVYQFVKQSIPQFRMRITKSVRTLKLHWTCERMKCLFVCYYKISGCKSFLNTFRYWTFSSFHWWRWWVFECRRIVSGESPRKWNIILCQSNQFTPNKWSHPWQFSTII